MNRASAQSASLMSQRIKACRPSLLKARSREAVASGEVLTRLGRQAGSQLGNQWFEAVNGPIE